ncbi:S1 family peptidase [Microscilla marina]|uniref:Trypsin domain protein n=1 Tax=Microscilla marina ATCC 23134 TaxID=313606 RepID=A1ZK23_MICM2|nr:serine protease [Microscilla marina]EAY29476.1 trypsin domain protein [Microscilla marina ATCC 23134]
MINNVLSPQQLENASVRILCGDEQGTGFFVDQDIILTAYHVIVDCIDENADIKINNVTYSKENVIDYDQKLDLCLIRTNEPTDTILPLTSANISYKQNCSTYGYPYSGEVTGERIEGKVDTISIDTHWGFSFNSEQVSEDVDYSGLSGGAVVSNHQVVGIVLLQRNSSVAAISVEKAQEFLTKNNIVVVKEESLNEIPEQLKNDVESSTPNYTVFQELTETLETQTGWFLCVGSPGSGKTTFAAAYNPDSENIKVCGRYFTKIPQDKTPLSVRISERNLISWIETTFSENTGQQVEQEENHGKRLERISLLLNNLANHYKGTQCVLLIDGLDEVKNLDSFLGVLPENLPDNLSIVLSCTSRDILPTHTKALIDENSVIEVTPLDIGQCEAFIQRELKKKEISTENIQAIARKSEGHPLYLRYLINYLLLNDVATEKIEDWVETIPAIGGEISKYYESLWDKFFKEETKLWIVLILSQIRQPVAQDILIKMLPANHQLSFYSHFEPINYLLKGEARLELYHASFKNFISNKVSHSIPLANDEIIKYCDQSLAGQYSLENRLHHYTLSSSPIKSLEICNQDWADNAAQHHVNPDLVTQDIRSVINIAVDERATTELIRVLLLLQRIEFRYDSVFAEHAFDLAEALIALGEYEAAIKYLVRDNTLLISEGDAIYFLQLLYENKAIKAGERLFSALDAKYRLYLKDEFGKKDEEISLEPFINQVRSLCLFMYENPKDGYFRIQQIRSFAKKMMNLSIEKDAQEMHEAFYDVREKSNSWLAAYIMRKSNDYLYAKELPKDVNITIDETWARTSALSINYINYLNYYSARQRIKGDTYYKAIADIEWLIESYGYENDTYTCSIIIEALIGESKNVKVVENVINTYIANEADKPLNLRDKNGVDFNVIAVRSFYFYQKCVGYIQPECNISDLPKHWHNGNLESGFCEIIKSLARLHGALAREKAEGNQMPAALEQCLGSIIATLNFKLASRVHWERSYHLPESIVPFIYEQVVQLYIDFFPDSVDTFISNIKDTNRHQLGIYTEGYRKALASVIRKLIKGDKKGKQTILLIGVLENHIVSQVQNRWERTPELLNVVQFYGLVDLPSKAKATFAKMLDTSMGPTWYKEAQFQLINTNLQLKGSEKHAAQFAALLDYASGEMTFQRYIRHNKESFIEELAQKGKLTLAIEYLKFETVPPVDVLIQNAEHFTVDSIALGKGNVQGANNLAIQSGALNILKHIPNVNPLIRVALCSIFTVNDETFRYVDGYATEMAKALNEIENEDHQTLAFEIVTQLLKSEDFKDAGAGAQTVEQEFVNNLRNALTEEVDWELYQFINGKSVKPPQQGSTQDDNSEEEQNCFTKFNQRFSNEGSFIDPKKLIEQGMKAFREERISVWDRNWSTLSTQARKNLKKLFKNDQEAIKSLSPYIKRYNNNTWAIVDNLIWFWENNLSEGQIDQINRHSSNHFKLLIRPEKYVFDKYRWMEKVSEDENQNEQMLKFIIWLLNHPLDAIRNDAHNALVFLSKVVPEQIILPLISEVVEDKPGFSRSLCSEILKEMAFEQPAIIIDLLNSQPQYLQKIVTNDHFSILVDFMIIGEELKESGYTVLYDALIDKFPDETASSDDARWDDDILSLISEEIDDLDELGILNDDFYEKLIQSIQGYDKIVDLKKSDKYLLRSYLGTESESYISRYTQVVHHLLNKAILPRVSKANQEAAYDIINRIYEYV